MNALALNAGSSTLKACLYTLDPGAPLATPSAPAWRRQVQWSSSAAKEEASKRLLHALWEGPAAPLEGPSDVDVVGHRVVQRDTASRSSSTAR
jgi:acetate kinase